MTFLSSLFTLAEVEEGVGESDAQYPNMDGRRRHVFSFGLAVLGALDWKKRLTTRNTEQNG